MIPATKFGKSDNKVRWLYISDYDSHAKCVEHGQRLLAEGCRVYIVGHSAMDVTALGVKK